MATNEVPRGPITGHVVDNVKRLRAARKWSLADLSQAMTNVGRPIAATGLHRMEQGRRRVDVDDLVALAAALDVAPMSLMMPFTATGTVALTDTLTVDALAAWDWHRGTRPLDLPTEREEAMIAAVAFQGRAVPLGARALPEQLTAFYAEHERRGEVEALDWDAFEKRREAEGGDDGEHRPAS